MDKTVYKTYKNPTDNPWNNLSMADKAAMMEVAIRNGITTLPEIREAYNEFAKGGDISDENYYEIMERVAKENWQKWEDPSEDAALTRILNSNDYNYRAYYNKYPESQANADTHWTDEFKTVWHPTFSNQSIYSGKKSEYNPDGMIGGMWLEDAFVPQAWQVVEENKREEENLFDRGGAKKKVFLSSLDQSLKEDNRFDSAEWRQFFTDLADMESGYSSNITNSIGAKGYFQLMPSNRAKAWKNPTQQFHEMYKLTGNNLNYLNKNLTKEDWKRADALGIDMYGMLAGAHLGGAGNVLKALRGKGNAKDMNGSSVMGYMTRFSQKGKTPTLATPSYVEEAPIPLFTPSNSEVFFGGYKAPEIEAPLPSIELDDTPQYSEEEIARQERRERLNNLSMLMSLTSPQGSSNSMLDALGLLMR